jgi:hypothetical protein
MMVPIDTTTARALARLARYEQRDTRHQASLILVRELQRLGYLNPGDYRAAQPVGEGEHAPA